MPKVAHPTKPLATVNVYKRQKDGSVEIEVCFLPDPNILVGEGNSKAFLALDASASMMEMYGMGGSVFMPKPNYAEAVAKKLGALLSGVSKTGKVGACYWAVNFQGDKTEWIGEFNEAEWASAAIKGPKKEKWGKGTLLLPALKLAVEQVHKGSDWTMAVFITDGIIGDEQDCMNYCLQLGKQLNDGKMKPIKMILIGAGTEVDEAQLERFDDMFEGTDLEGKVDLWATSPVNSLQDESDILGVLYGELMDEETVVAQGGSVESGSGNNLTCHNGEGKPISTTDVLPGKFRFFLPKGETLFRIHAAGQVVEQDCADAIARI